MHQLASECKLHRILSRLTLFSNSVPDGCLPTMFLPEQSLSFGTTNMQLQRHQFLDVAAHFQVGICDELFPVKHFRTHAITSRVIPLSDRLFAQFLWWCLHLLGSCSLRLVLLAR